MSEYVGRVFAKSCEDMSEIPDGVVQTCVTSPPYYGLRDYGAKCQIGLESSLDEYVARLVAVFREVRRVLRDDGVLWLNLGDSYAGSWGAQGRSGALSDRSVVLAQQIAAHPHNTSHTGTIRDAGLKPKDLIGVPWTVAFALRADGWWLRDAIVWHKPACMPSSVTDRCTPSYEMVFMLTKSARYFTDMKAIANPLAPATVERIEQARWKSGEQAGSARANGCAKTNGPMRAVVNAKGAARPPQIENGDYNTTGANPRNVWTIATRPYSDAHFATFPPELAVRCIRAGSSEGGCCAACGASRVAAKSNEGLVFDASRRQARRAQRLIEQAGLTVEHLSAVRRCGISDTARSRDRLKSPPVNVNDSDQRLIDEAKAALGAYYREVIMADSAPSGFVPSCNCIAPTVPSLIFDPFMGSGTTAEAAESLGRRWTGYEINSAYHALIAERTRQAGLFSA